MAEVANGGRVGVALPSETRTAAWRELALLGIGALCAIIGTLAERACATRPAAFGSEARVQYWAADRDGDHVFGLDSELLLRTKKPVRRPVRVAGRVDGGAWILHVPGPGPGPHGLLRIDEWGTTEAAVTLAETLDLVTWRGRDALVLERGTGAGGLDRVLRIDAAGRVQRLYEAPDLRCLASRGEQLLVGDAHGGVRQLSLDSGRVQERVVPCSELAVRALAFAGGGEGAWLLSADLGHTLSRLDSKLEPVWSMPTELDAQSFVASERGERLWLADATQPKLRLYGARGKLEFQREVPLAGLSRGTPTADGGVLLAAPGALLRFDRYGRLQPGQGGFRFLVDVTGVPSRPAVGATGG